MKKSILLVFCLISISNSTYSQYNLEIEISGIRNNTGNIMLQLFDSTEKVLIEDKKQIADNSCTFTLSNLNQGRYAIRYYHDENMNGKMETTKAGKPTEGYGFSNNVIGIFGPPPFKKWLFEISADMKIFLKPTY